MSERSIWDKLRAKGFSENATAAIMGNMQAESGLCAYRLQGDFSDGWTKSITYTSNVDRGAISKNDFIYNGPGGGGYGLCQWTFYSRKLGLYDLAKSRGVSIGDEQVGIDWFYEEVQHPEYSKTWNALKGNGSIYDMTTVMLRNFEKPADQSDSQASYRNRLAHDIYDKYAGTPEPSPEPTPTPTPTPSPDTCQVTARVLRYGDRGTDVTMFQYYLVYICGENIGTWGENEDGIDGVYGHDTEDGVNRLRISYNLNPDGVVDGDLWQIFHQ